MAATKTGIVSLKDSENGLPWNYPDELQFYKDITRDQILIMGRKTYNEKHNQNNEKIILSKNQSLKIENSKIFSDLFDLLEYIKNYETNKKIFMIGGGQIANLFLEKNLISEFYLTEINNDYYGDSSINLDYFKLMQKEEIKKTDKNI